MKEEQGNNLFVFVLAVLVSLVCTVTAYISMEPENIQSSKIIIFRHPENAS